MLTSRDTEDHTVLHIACLQGSHMIEFILTKAKELGIAEMLINSLNEKKYTPLFMLCQRGYFKKNEKNEYKEHEKRLYYVKLLLLNPHYTECEDLSHLSHNKGQKP